MSKMLLSADPFEFFGYVLQGSRLPASGLAQESRGSLRPYRPLSDGSIYFASTSSQKPLRKGNGVIKTMQLADL